MLEPDPSFGEPYVDANSTLLTPSESGEAVKAVSASDTPLAAGSRLTIDVPNPQAGSEISDDDQAESPVAESAILAELDNDLRFADLEKSSWLPAHPLITDPLRHIGSVFGAYRVLELLGKGGMGYVYRAEHIKLGRPVALKLLRTDYGARKDAITRFFREAKTVNRIRHRNIIDVTDFVELGDGTAFIIMELLQGQSFGKWARSGVDLRRALSVLVQICDGLGAAHAVGVIHRDLKPDNIVVIPMADGSELVKLLDFGVAKLTRRHDGDASYDTQVGALVGTPAYMSPEQAGGMVIDHRSDIYSLGTLMYELFCNQPMFRGRSFGEYVRKHLTEVPTLPRSTPGGAAIPVALEQIIMRCLAKDPNARYDTSFKLRDDLLGVLASLEQTGARSFTTLALGTPTEKLPLMLVPPAQLVPPAPLVSTPRKAISRRSWWIAGALIVAGGVAGAVWMGRESSTQPLVVKATTTEPILPDHGLPASAMSKISEPARAEAASAQLPVPAFVELRFNSVPSGSVFAAGNAAELCRTPCAFNVDRKDNESSNARTFVVRSAGYREQSITVDLTSRQRDFYIELARLPDKAPPAEPAPAAKSAARPSSIAGKRESVRDTNRTAPTAGPPTNVSEPDPSPWEGSTFEDDQTSSPDESTTPGQSATSSEPAASPTQGIAPGTTHNPFQRNR